ncbi:hypothetical protein BU23DRAFT_28381 [Bimuria novae-zelandiae CBS 107.79]|uniref:Uncharacterized protein n=1 Tax=Bimuria novae-zelandiae CBS 107.79 TaxID=1447943 RepID=A0A6A5VHJ5_9PLEO|nr:hypothetical protein BU23DRAFT_28381 [Bimuria novae-zelandiae CBS 107.79]
MCLCDNWRRWRRRLLWGDAAEKVVICPPHAARTLGQLRTGRIGGLASSAFFLLLLRKDRHRCDGLVAPVPAVAGLAGEKFAAKLLRTRVKVGEDLLLLLVGDTIGGVGGQSSRSLRLGGVGKQTTTLHRQLAGRCWFEKVRSNWLPRLKMQQAVRQMHSCLPEQTVV